MPLRQRQAPFLAMRLGAQGEAVDDEVHGQRIVIPVCGLERVSFFHVLGIIIPID